MIRIPAVNDEVRPTASEGGCSGRASRFTRSLCSVCLFLIKKLAFLQFLIIIIIVIIIDCKNSCLVMIMRGVSRLVRAGDRYADRDVFRREAPSRGQMSRSQDPCISVGLSVAVGFSYPMAFQPARPLGASQPILFSPSRFFFAVRHLSRGRVRTPVCPVHPLEGIVRRVARPAPGTAPPPRRAAVPRAGHRQTAPAGGR